MSVARSFGSLDDTAIFSVIFVLTASATISAIGIESSDDVDSIIACDWAVEYGVVDAVVVDAGDVVGLCFNWITAFGGGRGVVGVDLIALPDCFFFHNGTVVVRVVLVFVRFESGFSMMYVCETNYELWKVCEICFGCGGWA